MGRQVLDGFCNKSRQVLLVRLEREEGVDALEGRVVGGDFLVEMQSRDRGAVVDTLFHNGDRGIIAGSLDGERHHATPGAAACGGQP